MTTCRRVWGGHLRFPGLFLRHFPSWLMVRLLGELPSHICGRKWIRGKPLRSTTFQRQTPFHVKQLIKVVWSTCQNVISCWRPYRIQTQRRPWLKRWLRTPVVVSH